MIDTSPSREPDWLWDPALRAVLQALDAESGQARIVGGAVRNWLLGLPVADVDIATVWTPEHVVERIKGAGMKAVATGMEHGTITAISEKSPFEITTLRVDLTGDGRHAEIAYTRDWAADAARRDFTINALYLNSDGSLFDPLGGMDDITARRVRFIGNADDRIKEDYLRILRFFRFHAQFASGDMDRDGLTACIRARRGVATLSAERIHHELWRLLQVSGCIDTVETFALTGILTDILGGVAYTGSLRRLAGIEADLDRPPDPLMRLAVLGALIPEDAARLSERLRLSNAETARTRATVEGYWRLSPDLSVHERREWLYRLGETTYRDRVLFAWSHSPVDERWNEADWSALYDLPRHWSAPDMPFSAAQLKHQGVKPGPRMGKILRAAEDLWIEAGFPRDDAKREALLSRARDLIEF